MILAVNYHPRSSAIRFPLGLASVVGSLVAKGLPVEVLDTVPLEEAASPLIEGRLQEKEYKYVLLSAIAGGYSYGLVKSIISRIKEKSPASTIILGGALPSSIPDMFLRSSEADVCVIGEGEETIVELVESLEESRGLGEVAGIAFRNPQRKIVKSPPRARIKNLDMLPPIPYEMFPFDFYLNYIEKTGRCHEIIGGRGCYGNCDFCYKTVGKGVTLRSIDSIITDMVFLSERYGIHRFNFTDENFFNSRKRILQFADRLSGLGLHFEYRFQCRTDFIDADIARILAKSGVTSLNFGIESPVQQLLRNVNKSTSPDTYDHAIRLCQNEGIEVYTSFIIGLPGETEGTLQATEEFISRNRLENYCDVNFLTPLPNTRLYAMAIERGYIIDEEEYVTALGNLYNELYVNFTDLTDKILIDFKRRFDGKKKSNTWHEDFSAYMLRE